MTSPIAPRLSNATFYAAASVAAGGLHYFFQLWAFKQLSDVEFGELTSWVAYFSVALSLGAFAQYAANFFSISSSRLRKLSWLAVGLAVVSMLYATLSEHASGWAIGFIGVLMGVSFSWFSGQAQARLAFTIMGIGILMTGIAKFALAGATFPVDNPSLEMAWAISLSYSPALIFMALIMILYADHWKDVKKGRRDLLKGLGATAILSFASVFVPQMDIITVHLTQTPEQIGEFAKVSLLYKAVFFGFLIFAQWLLPHQMSESHSSPGWANWISSNRWRTLLVSLGLGLFAFACSLTVATTLNPDFKRQGLWIALSCLNMVLLTNLFFFIQVSSVKERLVRPLIILLGLISEVGLGVLFKSSITNYLIMVVGINTMLWLLLTRDSRRSHAATY